MNLFKTIPDFYKRIRRENIGSVVTEIFVARAQDFWVVQVGGGDGVTEDPVRASILKHRWKGVIAEPNPSTFKRLTESYSEVDNVTTANVAIATHDGKATLYCLEEIDHLPPWATGLASFNLDVLLRHQELIPDVCLKDHVVEKEVDCITFTRLLEDYAIKKANFVQIDTEGYDFEVIKMIDFDAVKPDILRYEYVHLNAADQEAAATFLKDRGYALVKEDVWNMFCYRDSIKVRLTASCHLFALAAKEAIRKVVDRFKLGRKLTTAYRAKIEPAILKQLYVKSILKSKPLQCSAENQLELHSLVCKNDVLLALWSFKTFAYFSEIDISLVLHEDGSLDESDIRTLKKHFPGVRIIRYVDAASRMREHLADYKNCTQLRYHKRLFWHGMKLLDLATYSDRQRIMVIDPDVLFFKRPTELLECLASETAFFNGNGISCYDLSSDAIARVFPAPMIPAVNSGLYCVPADIFRDLDLIDSIIGRYLEENGDFDKWAEQTFFAGLISKLAEKEEVRRLSPDYALFMVDGRDAPGVVFFDSSLLDKTSVHFCWNSHWHAVERRGIPLLRSRGIHKKLIHV